MEYYIGNTDLQWFSFLERINPEDINFWQPSGLTHFRAIGYGCPFLLKLKRPINKVAGIGIFTSHSILPINFAWDVFKERNGAEDFGSFYSKIRSYRESNNPIEKNSNVGCIVLTSPIFFEPDDWVTIPEDWSRNIVQGKTYSTENGIGQRYWQRILSVLNKYPLEQLNNSSTEPTVLYKKYLTNIRVGQGAFRVLVTDAYSRRCAISGERTLPVLEAAHIKPYTLFGINSIDNGLLLRADLHKLFDSGYITVTESFNIEISRKIKEEYENGKDYYKYHGQSLISKPNNYHEIPRKDYLRWHNETVFKT